MANDARAFCAFALETRAEETVACHIHRLKELAGMVRHASAQAVLDVKHVIDVDRVVLGHPPDASGPRLSILPLPSIGHPHSDGHIRRVMLAESAGGDGSLCDLLAVELLGTTLKPEHLDDAICTDEVCLVQPDPGDRVIGRYVDSATVWASVTPVLLPGYDDRKAHRGDHRKRLDRAEQLVCKALAQAGIDAPASIELSRVPYWAGSLHAREYRPRQKLMHYPRWHVRLTFDRPRGGPLAIGAGRHCGFGLLAPF